MCNVRTHTTNQYNRRQSQCHAEVDYTCRGVDGRPLEDVDGHAHCAASRDQGLGDGSGILKRCKKQVNEKQRNSALKFSKFHVSFL